MYVFGEAFVSSCFTNCKAVTATSPAFSFIGLKNPIFFGQSRSCRNKGFQDMVLYACTEKASPVTFGEAHCPNIFIILPKLPIPCPRMPDTIQKIVAERRAEAGMVSTQAVIRSLNSIMRTGLFR